MAVQGRRSGRRIAALGAAFAVILAVGWALLGRDGRAAAPAYVTEPLTRGAIAAVVTATGVVQPVVTVQVGTYVSGPILAIDADFNSPVKKGQRVAKIDPAPFEMKVRGAEANLANARAAVAKARADLTRKELALARSRELQGRDYLSQDALDASVSDAAQARAQVALAEAGVRQAQASLDEAKVQLSYTDIVSPVDGVVISRTVDVGQTVAASFQTPTLFQIAEDLSKMNVVASVSESDIGGVAEGQAASFRVDAWPDRSFAGRIVQVRRAPIAVQNVVTYEVLVEVANADLALRPGMTANVEITTASRDDALRIPLKAIRFRPEAANGAAGAAPAPVPARAETPAAYRVAGGELERVELKTGIRDERWAEVLEGGGLADGDPVVVAYPKAEGGDGAAPAQSPFQRRFR
jgi:HlyD family secretion protein